MNPVPYKFLDYYTKDDQEIFFGRHREIEILLADVVAARLVVLFAKTGTGKSSLINAGVRPKLERLGYRTFLLRVGDDPVESIREELRATTLLVDDAVSLPLAEQLPRAARACKQPLVLFFDQFEEFFRLARDKAEVAKSFIRECGAIHRNTSSGVHLVFSLREDYLAEMDSFREEIPTIFRSESQLRLQPLNCEQAKKAIEGPGARVTPPFAFQAGVVASIAGDLVRNDGFISPVALQIVCDTLWRTKSGPTITHELYTSLGGADGILKKRLGEDIAGLPDDELLIFEKLIPILTSAKGTKQAATMTAIESTLCVDRADLQRFIDRLLKLRLVRTTTYENVISIEWVSDYLSGLASTLLPSIQILWLRRMTDIEAIENADALLDRTSDLLESKELPAQLEERDWITMLLLALASRDTLGRWFSRVKAKIDPWSLIKRTLERDDLPEARLRLLMLFVGEFTEDQTIEILVQQLAHSERAEIALRALGSAGSERVVDIVAQRLENPALRAAAMDALRLVGSEAALKLAGEAAKSEPGFLTRLFTKKKRDLPPFREGDWKWAIENLRQGSCVPLLGPNEEERRLRKTIAQELAAKYRYPFPGSDNFDAVIEYLGVLFGAGARRVFEVEGIPKRLNDTLKPSALETQLARYPITLFITTSYATTLEQALKAQDKQPERRGSLRRFARSGNYPFLHHIFGQADEPESLALTNQDAAERVEALFAGEDDEDGLPMFVRASATRSALLVAGLDVANFTFSLILQALFSNARYRFQLRHLIILPPPETEDTDESFKRAVKYLDQYAVARGFRTFWGTQDDFAAELTKRWEIAAPSASPTATPPAG